jgi:hypothetical protein
MGSRSVENIWQVNGDSLLFRLAPLATYTRFFWSPWPSATPIVVAVTTIVIFPTVIFPAGIFILPVGIVVVFLDRVVIEEIGWIGCYVFTTSYTRKRH